MNKIIFQIGLLVFCVSVVIFAVMGNGMMEVLAKSFIVFIAAIVTVVGIVVGASMLSEKEKQEPESQSTPA